jgi:hypothetical protein
LSQLQNRLACLLREPHHGAHGERRRPLHFVEQPRRREPREIGGRGAIDVERRVRMLLQKSRRDLDIDFTLDGTLDDACLMLPGRKDNDLARVENRRDPHRERLTRNVLLAEEIGCGILARHVVEMHLARSTLDARSRLVEADVTRFADAKELQIDPPRLTNRLFIPETLELDVLPRRVAAGDVHVLALDVDVREQILPHEPVIAVDAVRPHGVVLVEIERHNVGERQPFVAVEADELAIDTDRCGARGESEDRLIAAGFLLADQRCDA